MSWSRRGDFFAIDFNRSGQLIHQVNYRVNTFSGLVKEIFVSHYSDHDMMVDLQATKGSHSIVIGAVLEFFQPDEVSIPKTGLYYVKISISTKVLLNKLRKVFDYLNDKYNAVLFSGELINEINLIHESIYYPVADKVYKHTMAKYIHWYDRVNPARKNSKQLVKLIDGFKELDKAGIKKFKKLLTQGEDTQQRNEFGQTVFYHAIYRHKNPEILELLVVYDNGEGPFIRDNGSFYMDAHEMALESNQMYKVKILEQAVSRIRRPPQGARQSGVLNADVYFHDGKIISDFECANNVTINTVFQNVQRITSAERKAVYELFAMLFEVPSDQNNQELLNIFNQELAHKNKFIEIIRIGNAIVGFNLFRFVILPEYPKHMFVICDYTMMHPQYRGFAIIPLLGNRPAYALQLLLPDYKVGIFFSAVHYNSYRMVRGLNYPMHQPEWMEPLILALLKFVYQGQPDFVHDVMTCYVKENIKVKGAESIRPTSDIWQKFFYKYILGRVFENEKDPRSAPVLYFVDDENYEKLEATCLDMGIHLLDNIVKMAVSMQQFMADLTGKKVDTKIVNGFNAFKYIKNTHRFWQQYTAEKNTTQNDEPLAERARL